MTLLLNLYEYSAYELLLFFVPHCKVSEVIVFSMPVPVLLYLSPFTFTEKFDCDILFSPKVNFVLSVISIIKPL